MRVIKFILKFILGTVMLVLALAWMLVCGAFGVACFASVFFAPVGIAAFGLATMPLWAALAMMTGRRHSQQVIVNVNR